MVNFIEQRSFHSGILKEYLPLHKEIQWLSRGKVLSRVFELKGVLLRQQKKDFVEYFEDEEWLETNQFNTLQSP